MTDGLPADLALAAAQRACRSRPSFSAPRHWAGFALVGEGDAVIPVRRRPQHWPMAAGFGVLALLVFLYYRRH